MTRPQPTAAERDRFRAIQEIGSIVSYINGHPGEPCDIHHLTEGGRRLGHRWTIGLTPWEHRGVVPEGMDGNTAIAIYGPSLAISPRQFHDRYGTERELLAMTDELIAGLKLRRVG